MEQDTRSQAFMPLEKDAQSTRICSILPLCTNLGGLFAQHKHKSAVCGVFTRKLRSKTSKLLSGSEQFEIGFLYGPLNDTIIL